MPDALPAKIGLELHIYPRTECKMFCSCSSSFLDAEPNTVVCPVCTGQPGAKPLSPNSAVIAVLLQLADVFGMERLRGPVRILRKHYFYPDLPCNYQRTSEPVASGGSLSGCRLREIHFEEDPGQYDLPKGKVDFNRSGVPLIELVTEPDIRDSRQAKSFLSDLLLVLQYLGCAREEMPFKVDTNISVGGRERVEVKNINSASGVVQAIEYEIERQSELIVRGEAVDRETRHFDAISGTTVSLRFKENLEDYRYFPDPDLPPVDISAVAFEKVPSPFGILERMTAGGAREPDARTVLADRNLLRLFERVELSTDTRFASTFVARDIKGELNYRRMDSSSLPSISEGIVSIAVNYAGSRLSNQNASLLLRKLFDGQPIGGLLEELTSNWHSSEEIVRAAADVMRENADAVKRYINGNREVMNFLVGQCMKRLGGKARPGDIANVLMKEMGRMRKPL